MGTNESSLLEGMSRLRDLCARLRGPDGCSWDRAQTGPGLAPYLAEEVQEVLEALALGDVGRLEEEIGDALYLWVLFLTALESEGTIRIAGCVGRIEDKLSRRHPEVFGSIEVSGVRDPETWEERKRRESPPDTEPMKSLPAGIPALARARRLQEKAAAFGFDWGDLSGVTGKIREEIDELASAIDLDRQSAAVSEELGDLLFAVVNLARHLGRDPEATLIAAAEKFRSRFNLMAGSLESDGYRLGRAKLETMEAYWQEAKRVQRRQAGAPPEAGRET